MKDCCRCGVSRPASAEFFSRSKNSKDGFTAQCKPCRSLMWKEQYEKRRQYHIDRASESTKRRRGQPEGREKERVQSRERKRISLADPVKRELHRQRTREWFSNNRAREKKMPSRSRAVRAHRTMLRIARQKLATPVWSDLKAIAAIYEEAQRRTAETGVPHEVDHIVPLNHDRVCGLHVPSNLRVITADENRAKSNHFLIN